MLNSWIDELADSRFTAQARKFLWIWALALLALRLGPVLFSSGYDQTDEHFQILEFARYKQGRIPAEYLAWEFPARIRPGLQPWIAVQLLDGMEAVGIESPVWQVRFLRFLSALLSTLALTVIALLSFRWVRSPAGRMLILVSGLLCWFLPHLGVRFSAEGLSADFLALGLAAVVVAAGSQRAWTGIAAGFLLGLAFDFRPQSAFFLLGVAIWLLTRRPLPFRTALICLLGGFLALGVGTLADRWLYGEWEFSPYNYFVVNLLEGKAAEFGTDPFYTYFRMLFVKEGLFLWGPALLLSGLVLLIRRPLHPVVLGCWLFFLGHSAIAHKEDRFIYPLAVFIPMLLGLGFEALSARLQGRITRYSSFRWGRIFVSILLLVNGIYLIAGSILPPEPRIRMLESIYSDYQTENVLVLNTDPEPLYWMGRFLRITFYYPPHYQELEERDFKPDTVPVRQHNGPILVFKKALPAEARAYGLPGCHCQPRYQYPPPWVRWVDWDGWVERTPFKYVIECRKIGTGASQR